MWDNSIYCISDFSPRIPLPCFKELSSSKNEVTLTTHKHYTNDNEIFFSALRYDHKHTLAMESPNILA